MHAFLAASNNMQDTLSQVSGDVAIPSGWCQAEMAAKSAGVYASEHHPLQDCSCSDTPLGVHGQYHAGW